MTSLPPVLTPEMLAEYWGCSGRHVRNLINRGELSAFRIGAKLVRIRRESIEEFESRNAEPSTNLDTDPCMVPMGAKPDRSLSSDPILKARLANLRDRRSK